jgi:hypothetical protein
MNTKHYFEKHSADHKSMTLYGPFPTIEAARQASFFSRDANDYHHERSVRRSNGRWAFRTSGYDDNEIASLLNDPAVADLHKFTLKAKAPVHVSWKRFKAEFRASYFADSYKQTFGVAFE